MVQPEIGKVVPPACLSTLGEMDEMDKPQFLAKASLIRVFEAPLSNKELTRCVPYGVDSHKYNGGVRRGVLEQYST